MIILTRSNSRLTTIALTLFIVAALASGAVIAASATDTEPVEPTQANVVEEAAEPTVDEIIGEDEVMTDETGMDFATAEREALLAEWDALHEERRMLMQELEAVHHDMREVASELWAYELEETRERVREQLNRYGGHYGEDLVEWLPPRLLELMSELTDRTSDELRDMVQEGAWGELWEDLM